MAFGPANRPIRDWPTRKVWVVGASTGIGAALAQALLARGARVVLSARNAARLEQVADGHASATVCALDATDATAWQAIAAQIHTDADPLDLLVYCAADYQPERVWNVKAADVDATITVNLNGAYYGLEAVLPRMVELRRGGVALVASVAGYVGLPGAAVYGPTKAALINLAELAYCEVASRGVGMYLVNPGFVATRLTAKNRFYMPALRTPEQAAEAIVRGFERGRFEIHFPRRFTLVLKLLRILPQRLRLYLLSRLAQP
jgi:short-subunit dehydrogenase